MRLFSKPLNTITIDNIEAIVRDGIPESRTLDYKLELHPATEGGNKEFLKDLSAFANTMGGCLIYGIEEEAGIPKIIQGVEIENFDKLKLHFENLLRTGVDPAIRGVDFAAVDLGDGKKVVVVEVPRSASRPHMVKIKGHNKFYGRNSAGVHQLEVDDLRRVFLATETLATKIRAFRNDRLSMIAVGDTLIPLCSGAKIVLHIIPTTAFELGESYVFKRDSYEDFPPIGVSSIGYFHKINFDGLLTYFSYDLPAYTYTQIFNNGIIEAVDSRTLQHEGDAKKIPSVAYEIQLINALNIYLSSIVKYGIGFPVWVCLSLLEVKDYQMLIPPSKWFHSLREKGKIDRDELIISEIQVENNDAHGEYILKPAFDSIWNACGCEGSLNYDKDGKCNLEF